jgi:uncharacterized protein YjbI with pentapeptide repeats
MADQEQLEILKQGVDRWNAWRDQNQDLKIHLKGANLNKRHSNIDLSDVDLCEHYMFDGLYGRRDLKGINLRDANLVNVVIRKADLHGADLRHASLSGADLRGTDLSHADLSESFIHHADLSEVNLSHANLKNAILWETNLSHADLSGADLTHSNLARAILIGTKVDRAKLSGSRIYGINVWDLEGEFAEQKDLIISKTDIPGVTVDNIKVAQFIYQILNNAEIRGVIDTLTSRSVLILGRFAIAERKAILESLRNKLREYGLLPIVFDFERPIDQDFTETIKTLAGLSYFVIADITNPKSSPLELHATVPDYQIPFVPIIQEGERPFAMMVDLQKKYNWVLNTVSYDSQETLMKVLKPLIIDPAMKKRQELRIIKAQEPEIISAKDFLAKGSS